MPWRRVVSAVANVAVGFLWSTLRVSHRPDTRFESPAARKGPVLCRALYGGNRLCHRLPWLWRLNRLVNYWALAQYGRQLPEAVRWGIVWRGGLISLASFLVGGALIAGAEWAVGGNPKMMTVLQILFLVAFAIVSMLGFGWAMSIVVTKRVGPPHSETEDLLSRLPRQILQANGLSPGPCQASPAAR